MREISEYTLIGNYLIFLSERLAQDSLKYEHAKLFSEKVLSVLNKSSTQYTILPIEKKLDIVRKMISRGVFKTDASNSTRPFKQIYNFETSKFILAFFSSDNNLVFKLQKHTNDNKEIPIEKIKQIYSANLSLELQNAMTAVMAEFKPAGKGKFKAK